MTIKKDDNYADQDQLFAGSHLDDNGNESTPQIIEMRKIALVFLDMEEDPSEYAPYVCGNRKPCDTFGEPGKCDECGRELPAKEYYDHKN